MRRYVEQQKHRIFESQYFKRKTSHILENESRYLFEKWEQKQREQQSWLDFIPKIRHPIKGLFIELLLHPEDENAITIQSELLLYKGLSPTFLGWLLSLILTTKMIVADIQCEDSDAVCTNEILLKSSIPKSKLLQYTAYRNIQSDITDISFVTFKMAYNGFGTLPVCLESGLALYYFPLLQAPFFKSR